MAIDELEALGLAEPLDEAPAPEPVVEQAAAAPDPAAAPAPAEEDELVALGLAEPLDEGAQPTTPPAFNPVIPAVQGAVKGGVTFGGLAAGMYYGGRLGAGVGFALGSAVPVIGNAIGTGIGVGVGALGGGIIGYLVADEVNDTLARVDIPGTDQPLTFASVESIPLEQRPWFNAGETFVGGLTFAVPVYGMAARGVSVGVNAGRRWFYPPNMFAHAVNGVIRGAQTHPWWFAAGEAQMAALAGAGAFGAEVLAPGDPGWRMVGELGGVALTVPGRAAYFAGMTGFRLWNQVKLAMSESAQLDALSRYLNDLAKAYGENPADIIAHLADSADELAHIKQTVGMRSKSPAMQALDAAMAEEDHRFGEHTAKIAGAARDLLTSMVHGLRGAGDPAALRTAAQLRNMQIEERISSRFAAARTQALRAAAEIDPSNARDLAAYGAKADDIISRARAEVEAVEDELWRAVDEPAKGIAAEFPNVIARVAELRGIRVRGTSDEKMPQVVEEFLTLPDRIAAAQKAVAAAKPGEEIAKETIDLANRQITAADLITLRRRMTTLARQVSAGEAPNLTDAHVYGQIADALLVDLKAIDDVADVFGEALEWSTKKFEHFNHTFAGKTNQTTRGGAERLDETLVMREAFSSVSEKAQLNFRQLSEAAQLGDEAAIRLREAGTEAMDAAQAAATQYATEMLAVQEQTLRFAAAQLVDRGTGVVDIGRLATFKAKYGALIDQFPNIREGLENAESATKFFESAKSGEAAARRIVRENTAFSKVLNGEDPSTAIASILKSDTPETQLRGMVNAARRSGAAAVEGLKSAVYNHLYDAATSSTGAFSPARFRELFQGSMTASGTSLGKALVAGRVIDQRHYTRTIELLDRMAEVEKAVAGHAPAQNIFGEKSAVLDATLKLLGIRLAKAAPDALKGHELFLAGIGSQFSRQVLDKAPQGKMKDLLIEALRDTSGETMRALLARQPNPREALNLSFKLNGALWRAGVGGLTEDD